MIKLKENALSDEDKSLLMEILLNQGYVLELVGSELIDLENGHKKADEERIKQLNGLYSRLIKAGY